MEVKPYGIEMINPNRIILYIPFHNMETKSKNLKKKKEFYEDVLFRQIGTDKDKKRVLYYATRRIMSDDGFGTTRGYTNVGTGRPWFRPQHLIFKLEYSGLPEHLYTILKLIRQYVFPEPTIILGREIDDDDFK